MDKNSIKKYAVWARQELIERVRQKAAQYGVTKEETVPADAQSIDGKLLSSTVIEQRKALIRQIEAKGYWEVMEEVAYTWFNRFMALRYMEVNEYLPSRVRVFTDADNAFHPQILAEAIDLDLEGLDLEKVYALKNANDQETLYKYLLITQCNALSPVLPGMFQHIADYTELLLPDNLLREGSVIEKMVTMIPEENWTDQVQIIGWLYQYYNSEKKDDVFAALKKNVKITKENIPAATQLFTPDWIVRYMVENSLGRLWLEGHPEVRERRLPTKEEQAAFAAGDRNEKDPKWHYYLEEAAQEPEVQAQLAEIRRKYAKLKPEEIKVIDPCCGSGHVLVYMFEVLMQIYKDYGYTPRAAVESILEHNLYGLDIDDRAAQQAYFAVMMIAVKYDPRLFRRRDADGNLYTPQPHVYAVCESGHLCQNGKVYKCYDEHTLSYFCNGDPELKAAMDTILRELFDAKEYGSILTVTDQNWDALYDRFDAIFDEGSLEGGLAWKNLLPLVRVAEVLAQKYDVVVTNPPYMGSPNMSDKLLSFIKKHYPDGKADIYAAFIQKCIDMSASDRYISLITQSTWMYQSRLEDIRQYLRHYHLVNMMHLGSRAFDSISGEVVQTTAFVYQKNVDFERVNTLFMRLVDYKSESEKAEHFGKAENKFVQKVDSFDAIPGIPFAYYLSQNAFSDFRTGVQLKTILNPKQGTSTGNDEVFVRSWFEVNYEEIGFSYSSTQLAHESHKNYFPLDKGGEYRKWYGDNERIIKFNESSYSKLIDMGNHLPSRQYYFLPGLTWSKIASKLSVRYDPAGFVFSSVGLKGFPSTNNLEYCHAFLNSKVCAYFLGIISPGISIVSGDIEKLPLIFSENLSIKELTSQCISLCQSDWDSFETSWDFQCHPLLQYATLTLQRVVQEEKNGYLPMNGIANAYRHWEQICNERFNQLKANEEELNRIFIDIYGLQDELTPEVEDEDVTVRKADLGRDIRSFISYAVGCMFGRYSLYKDGLIFAGEPYSLEAWVEKTNDQPGTISHEELVRPYHNEGVIVNEMFFPDKDNIIPICDDEYFDDDIVGRFVEFVKTVYGEDTLDENLKFIADALGGKGAPKEVIRNYFLNDFYADHCKIYQKRPIYWLFDSGKKNGFKALIYMHRYREDTIARIRTDYVHEQQGRYRTAIADLESRIANADTGSRVKLTKQLTKLQNQAEELRGYEEKIHHLADQMIRIDLDDGVKHNYELFQDVLAKIK